MQQERNQSEGEVLVDTAQPDDILDIERSIRVVQSPRLSIGHICQPFQPAVAIYVDVSWPSENGGVTADRLLPAEFFIYFAPRDSRNQCGNFRNSKSSQRMQLALVLRALRIIAATHRQGESVILYTKVAILTSNRSARDQDGKDSLGITGHDPTTLRMALIPDLVVQIEELNQWLDDRGASVTWKQFSKVPEEIEEWRRGVGEGEIALYEDGDEIAELVASAADKVSAPMAIENPLSRNYARVYTDGSTISVNGTFRGGFGVYFGYFDPRSECGPIDGKGTGPRASLVAIVRALELISKFNCGHRRWEIACNREQYIRSVFDLTERWKESGWKRNSGKPIANLDLYRGARRILDELIDLDFDLRGVHVPQKDMDRGIMVADLLARRGAGDRSILIPLRINNGFEVPLQPENIDPSVIVCLVEETDSVAPRTAGSESKFNGSWSIKFDGNDEDPRNRSGSYGSQSRTRTCANVLIKLLRTIEGEHSRSWEVFVNFNDVLTSIFNQLAETSAERPERRDRREGSRIRAGAAVKVMSTPYIDALGKRMSRLERHGYVINFKPYL